MMPILQASGVITPGQFGPMSRDVRAADEASLSTFIISKTGIPSVMQQISFTPAAAASRIASAAKGGGTKIAEALAPVASRASLTVSKTGRPKCVVTAFAGRHTTGHLRAIFDRLFGVESDDLKLPVMPLADHLCILVYENVVACFVL